MKKLLLLLLAGGMAAQAALAEPQWLTSLPEAEALAKRENKLILVDFTGSDWCVVCIRVEKEVFTKPAFTDYAKKNLVLVRIDFPLDNKQPAALKAANDALQAKYKVNGFPTFFEMKHDGTVVWTREGFGGGSPADFVALLDKARK